jgi:hypothetical protein
MGFRHRDVLMTDFMGGLGGTPLATGVEVIGDVLTSFSPDSLSEVGFVAYTADEREVFEEVPDYR